MNGPLDIRNFLSQYISDQMVHFNITMLSSIGAMACKL